MSSHILFVHGLGSKPTKDIMHRRYIDQLTVSTEMAVPPERFHVVYWADLVGHAPLTPEQDEFDDNRNNFKPYEWWEKLLAPLRGRFRRTAIEAVEKEISGFLSAEKPELPGGLERLFPDALQAVVRKVYGAYLPDLRKYFLEGEREPVKGRLLAALDDLPGGSSVCLVGHSMGSIIAMDVLLNEARNVDLFVTIGSPIGLEVIKTEIGVTDANQAQIAQRMKSWHNFYDRLDIVALDADLDDDYEADVSDEPVRNTFVDKDGERNPHKSYGYLRNPEVGEILGSFLRQG